MGKSMIMIPYSALCLLAVLAFTTKAAEVIEDDGIEERHAVACRDIYPQKTCSEYSSLCKFDKTMQEKCSRTCGICKIAPPAACEDSWTSQACQKYNRLCERSSFVRRKCKKTCGYCVAVSELPCQSTKYGCCWDNMTRATGPKEMGCPACKDVQPSCSRLAEDCHFSEVRRNCPVTCNLQCAGCQDNPSQARFCPYFQKSGFCTNAKALMKKYCPKTCSLCN